MNKHYKYAALHVIEELNEQNTFYREEIKAIK